MTVDADLALEKLREYRVLIEKSERPGSLEEQREFHDRMIALRPTIEKIAAALDPGIGPAALWYWATPGGGSTLVHARQALIRLIGIIETRDDTAAIFAPRGPQLAATGLHRWVWNAARDLWEDGHHRNAVHEAASKIEKMLQAKLGRGDVSGDRLIVEAFSLEPPAPGRPRLRFAGIDPTSERWKSAHGGAQAFGRGCVQGIRNWAAHELDEANEQLALEYLASLSVLARWIEQADVQA